MTYREGLFELLQLLKLDDIHLWHVVIEALLVLSLVWLAFAKRYRQHTPKDEPLSKKEEDELIAEFEPEPLAKPSTPLVKTTMTPVLDSAAGRQVLVNGQECVNFAIQKGLVASRSRIIKYAHNDMADLEKKLEAQKKEDAKDPVKAKATRRFLVTEGVLANSGDICPLPKLVEFKYKYLVRLIIDESFSFGVLGESGRGITEHFDVDPEEVDIMSVSMGTALASVGGFCAGRAFVIDHQRLSGQGYCYSASLPPLLANAALNTLERIGNTEGRQRRQRLRANVHGFLRAMKTNKNFVCEGSEQAPIVHVSLRNSTASIADQEQTLQPLVESGFKHGLALTRANYLRDDEMTQHRASIRVALSSEHTEEDTDTLVMFFEQAQCKIESSKPARF